MYSTLYSLLNIKFCLYVFHIINVEKDVNLLYMIFSHYCVCYCRPFTVPAAISACLHSFCKNHCFNVNVIHFLCLNYPISITVQNLWGFLLNLSNTLQQQM